MLKSKHNHHRSLGVSTTDEGPVFTAVKFASSASSNVAVRLQPELVIKRSESASVKKQGWLYKQGSDGLMLWKKRWVVLSEFCLFYYRGPSEEKVCGSILLPSYKISHVSRERKPFAFKAEHNNMRTYVFAAETKECMLEWINALCLASVLQEPNTTNYTFNMQHKRPDSSHFHAKNSLSKLADGEKRLETTVNPTRGFQNCPSRSYHAIHPVYPQHLNVRSQQLYYQPRAQGYVDQNYRLSNPQHRFMRPRQQFLPSNIQNGGPPIKRNMDASIIRQPLYANAPPKPRRLNASNNNTCSPLTPEHLHYQQFQPPISETVYDFGIQQPPITNRWPGQVQRHDHFIRHQQPYQMRDFKYQTSHFFNNNTQLNGTGMSKGVSRAQRPRSADILEDGGKSLCPEMSEKVVGNTFEERHHILSTKVAHRGGHRQPPRPKSSIGYINYASDEKANSAADNMLHGDILSTEAEIQQYFPTPSPRKGSRSNYQNVIATSRDSKQLINGKTLPSSRCESATAPLLSSTGYQTPSIEKSVVEQSHAPFGRSASARLSRQKKFFADISENSMLLSDSCGNDFGTKKHDQREESMKRLLEWKQRMLQSPLTRKSSRTHTPTNSMSPVPSINAKEDTRQKVLDQLQPREEIKPRPYISNNNDSRQVSRARLTPSRSHQSSSSSSSTTENEESGNTDLSTLSSRAPPINVSDEYINIVNSRQELDVLSAESRPPIGPGDWYNDNFNYDQGHVFPNDPFLSQQYGRLLDMRYRNVVSGEEERLKIKPFGGDDIKRRSQTWHSDMLKCYSTKTENFSEDSSHNENELIQNRQKLREDENEYELFDQPLSSSGMFSIEEDIGTALDISFTCEGDNKLNNEAVEEDIYKEKSVGDIMDNFENKSRKVCSDKGEVQALKSSASSYVLNDDDAVQTSCQTTDHVDKKPTANFNDEKLNAVEDTYLVMKPSVTSSGKSFHGTPSSRVVRTEISSKGNEYVDMKQKIKSSQISPRYYEIDNQELNEASHYEYLYKATTDEHNSRYYETVYHEISDAKKEMALNAEEMPDILSSSPFHNSNSDAKLKTNKSIHFSHSDTFRPASFFMSNTNKNVSYASLDNQNEFEKLENNTSSSKDYNCTLERVKTVDFLHQDLKTLDAQTNELLNIKEHPNNMNKEASIRRIRRSHTPDSFFRVKNDNSSFNRSYSLENSLDTETLTNNDIGIDIDNCDDELWRESLRRASYSHGVRSKDRGYRRSTTTSIGNEIGRLQGCFIEQGNVMNSNSPVGRINVNYASNDQSIQRNNFLKRNQCFLKDRRQILIDSTGQNSDVEHGHVQKHVQTYDDKPARKEVSYQSVKPNPVTHKFMTPQSPASLSITPQDLLGKTHEQLVIILINLRRQASNLNETIDTIEAQLEDTLNKAALDINNRNSFQKLIDEQEIRLRDLEHQRATGQPIINLVDNMVKLGTLYRGPGGAPISHRFRNSPVPSPVGNTGEPVTSVESLDFGGNGSLTNQQRADIQKLSNRSTNIGRKEHEEQHRLEEELYHVRYLLQDSQKKLAECSSEHSRWEHDFLILRQRLQSSASHDMQCGMTHSAETLMIESELAQVQHQATELYRRRNQLLQDVHELSAKHDFLTNEIRPSPGGIAGTQAIATKRKNHSTWLETDLDAMIQRDRASEVETMMKNELKAQMKSGSSDSVPLYVNTYKEEMHYYENAPTQPNSTHMYVAEDDLSKMLGDEIKRVSDMKTFENKENESSCRTAEIKTVRMVKRDCKERSESLSVRFPGENRHVAEIEKMDTPPPLPLPRGNSQTLHSFLSERSSPLEKAKEDYDIDGDNKSNLSHKQLKKSQGFNGGTFSNSLSSLMKPNFALGQHKDADSSRPGSSLSAHERLFGRARDPSSSPPSSSSNTDNSGLISPVFHSAAAQAIIQEISGVARRKAGMRRSHTINGSNTGAILEALGHVSNNSENSASPRSRDDTDIVKGLRSPNAPDVIRSALSHKDAKINSTIDNLIGIPDKILIPERYVPDTVEATTAEERNVRLKKADSIKRMLKNSNTIPTSYTAKLNTGQGSEVSSGLQERQEREHILDLNQILAHQVMEKSRIVAGSVSGRK